MILEHGAHRQYICCCHRHDFGLACPPSRVLNVVEGVSCGWGIGGREIVLFVLSSFTVLPALCLFGFGFELMVNGIELPDKASTLLFTTTCLPPAYAGVSVFVTGMGGP